GDYEAAAAHLEATLAVLKEIDVQATGRVGARDPLQAADDGLREFPAGEILFVVRAAQDLACRELAEPVVCEILFVVRAAGDTTWLEDGVVEQARSRYPIPVTEL